MSVNVSMSQSNSLRIYEDCYLHENVWETKYTSVPKMLIHNENLNTRGHVFLKQNQLMLNSEIRRLWGQKKEKTEGARAGVTKTHFDSVHANSEISKVSLSKNAMRRTCSEEGLSGRLP